MRRSTMFVCAVVLALVGASCTTGPGGGGAPTTTAPSGANTATITVAGEVVTVSVPVGLTVTVAPAAPSAVPAAPAGLVFPLGALDIDVHGVPTHGVVRVTVALVTPVDTVRKLIGALWDPFDHDGTTGATLSADHTTVTLDLQDGGRGDSDGQANGIIVDPFAPVNVTATTTTGTYLGQTWTFAVDAPSTLTVGAAPLAALPATPAGLVLDDGALDIGVYNVTPGASIQVTVDAEAIVPLLKYMIPATANFRFFQATDGSWFPFGSGGFGVTGWHWSGPFTCTVCFASTLSLQDGGPGDSDGVANGTILNRSGLFGLQPVVITSSAVIPAFIAGEPYSYQLEATGGLGPIFWSISNSFGSGFPAGITLSGSGLLSGTPQSPYPPSSFVQVTASQFVSQPPTPCDSTCDTQLIPVLLSDATTTVATTGATLPDGTGIGLQTFNVDPPPCSGCPNPSPHSWFGAYNANGTMTRVATASLAELAETGRISMNPAGTRIVAGNLVLDADTGQTITTLPTPGFGLASFSPNGAYLAVTHAGTGLFKILSTTDWSEVRNISWTPPQSGGVSAIWNPDSSIPELSPTNLAGGLVTLFNASDPTGLSDRTLPIGQTCGVFTDWSAATNRLALGCGFSNLAMVTASANGPIDVRVVSPNTCGESFATFTYPCSFTGGGFFSPNGANLLVGEGVLTTTGPQSHSAYTLDDDTPATTPTAITQTLTGFAVQLGPWGPWR